MDPTGPNDKTITLNELKFHYLEWGNAACPAMVLLHGFMGHAHVWDDFALKFRSRYHVISLDQRGHGESGWSETGAYTLDDHFMDLTTLIDRLHLKPLVLVGHSMGGRNALFYAACFPENVVRLILVDARPGNNPEASRALRSLVTGLPLKADSVEEAARGVQRVFPYLSLEVCRHLVKYGYSERWDGKLAPCYDGKMSISVERSGYVTEDLWRYLKNLSCPTLVVRGKESEFLSGSDARKMCKLIPNAVWHEVPCAAHVPHLENPEEFSRIVETFLAERKPGETKATFGRF
jgi:pimeloyl-ACP methyl ester carboxylesterase